MRGSRGPAGAGAESKVSAGKVSVGRVSPGRPPDGGWGWVVLLGVVVSYVSTADPPISEHTLIAVLWPFMTAMLFCGLHDVTLLAEHRLCYNAEECIGSTLFEESSIHTFCSAVPKFRKLSWSSPCFSRIISI